MHLKSLSDNPGLPFSDKVELQSAYSGGVFFIYGISQSEADALIQLTRAHDLDHFQMARSPLSSVEKTSLREKGMDVPPDSVEVEMTKTDLATRLALLDLLREAEMEQGWTVPAGPPQPTTSWRQRLVDLF